MLNCTVEIIIELFPLIPLSVALIIFEGHGSVKQFYLKILRLYPIKFRLCMIVDYVK